MKSLVTVALDMGRSLSGVVDGGSADRHEASPPLRSDEGRHDARSLGHRARPKRQRGLASQARR